MAPLGRAALLLAFGLVLYALVAGSYAAWKRRRRLALSAQNALLAAFPVTLVAAIILLVGKVVGPVQKLSGGLRRFQVKDINDNKPGRVFVDYSGSVPDLFGRGRDISVAGRMRHGSFAATPGSLITKCPDHYAPAKSSNT